MANLFYNNTVVTGAANSCADALYVPTTWTQEQSYCYDVVRLGFGFSHLMPALLRALANTLANS